MKKEAYDEDEQKTIYALLRELVLLSLRPYGMATSMVADFTPGEDGTYNLVVTGTYLPLGDGPPQDTPEAA